MIGWLAREHGPAAVSDLAEELAVDLAEAFDALAAVERREPVTVADEWFHDRPLPEVPELDTPSSDTPSRDIPSRNVSTGDLPTGCADPGW